MKISAEKSGLLLLAALGLVVLLVRTPLDDTLSFHFRQWLMQIDTRRLAVPHPEASRTMPVLVTIDDRSFMQMDLKWPWSREIYTRLIRHLKEHEARVIAFDVLFYGWGETEDVDREFGETIASHGRVVLGTMLHHAGSVIRPMEIIYDRAAATGYMDIPVNPSGTVWDFWLYAMDEAQTMLYPSLPLATAELYLETLPQESRRDLTHLIEERPPQRRVSIYEAIEGGRLKLDMLHRYGTRYLVRPEDFTKISIYDALYKPEVLSAVKDRIVIIGSEVLLHQDYHTTALGRLSGVVHQAMLTTLLLNDEPIVLADDKKSYGALALLALIAYGIFLKWRRTGISLMIVFAALSLIASAWLYLGYQLYFNPVPAVMGMILLAILCVLYHYLYQTFEMLSLKDQIAHDDLTGVFTFRYFKLLLERDLAVQMPGEVSSLVFIDLDHFKDINDNRGHAAGNDALRIVGEVLLKNRRHRDLISRFGGDEFVVLLRDSNGEKSKIYVQRVREQIQAAWSKKNVPEPLNFSSGIAVIKGPVKKASEKLLEKPDSVLYESKRRGRSLDTILEVSI